MDRLKSDLLNYAIHTRNLVTAITEHLKNVGKGRTDDSDPVVVPAGLVLAVMHWSIERVARHVSEFPLTVTGDEDTDFTLELGEWRARYDEKSDALSHAALFGTAFDRAFALDEVELVRETRAQCEGALAEVIKTLKPKVRKKI